MILFRSTFIELVPPFFLTFGVMSFILVMQNLYRLAALMAERRLEVGEVGMMLFYLSPQTFAITIPLGVVGAVFITVIRQSTDSEIICMRATGMNLWVYSLPFLSFGFLVSLAALVVSLWLHPLGYGLYTDLQLKIVKIHADQNLIPGKFNDEFGDKVIQIGARLPDKGLAEIFIADKKFTPGSPIITADRGQIEVAEETRQVFFKLRQGTVYVPAADQKTFSTVEFDNLNYLLELTPTGSVRVNRIKRASSLELWTTVMRANPNGAPYSRAILELFYRLTLPLACLVFVLAAIPMAIIDPRSGRSGSFLRAIFLVVTYYIIWIGFKDLVQSGNASAWVLWLPLLLVLVFGIVRLWQADTELRPLAALFRW